MTPERAKLSTCQSGGQIEAVLLSTGMSWWQCRDETATLESAANSRFVDQVLPCATGEPSQPRGVRGAQRTLPRGREHEYSPHHCPVTWTRGSHTRRPSASRMPWFASVCPEHKTSACRERGPGEGRALHVEVRRHPHGVKSRVAVAGRAAVDTVRLIHTATHSLGSPFKCALGISPSIIRFCTPIHCFKHSSMHSGDI